MDVSTTLSNIKLKNPTVLASGFLGTSYGIMKNVELKGAGAVTIKSIGFKKKEGNPNPCVIEFGVGVMNCVGLPTPGYKNMEEEWQELNGLKIPLFASIYSYAIEEYVEVAKYVAEKKPAMIELNTSCPHVYEVGKIFSSNVQLLSNLVKEVKKVTKDIPVFVKLSPNVQDIAALAVECEKAGADGITAINTVGPGMLINIEARKPVLAFKTGGVSGPAIRPIAVKAVYDIYKAVKIPIIGTGGIMTGRDAIEMMMAGASAVGVGTAIYYRDEEVFSLIVAEMKDWMKKNNVKSLKDIIGAAHV